MSALLTYLQAAAKQISYVLLSRCHAVRLPPGHFSRRRGRPAAFHRMPPSSQIDRTLPQVSQRAAQALDSASMEAAQERGTTARISFWTNDIGTYPHRHAGRLDLASLHQYV